MPEFELLKPEKFVGCDLSGWRIEKWYRIEPPNDPGSKLFIRWYRDEESARLAGIGLGRNGENIEPRTDIVLTQDGKNGYILYAYACIGEKILNPT